MKISLKRYFFFFLVVLASGFYSQNQTQKWYFGGYAGLDFSTSPPSTLTNGAMQSIYSCAAISDVSGNLLFYTDGATVWNQSHSIMSNGTGLFGTGSGNSSQGSIIIKQPGNTNLYYIFTTSNNWTSTTGFNYSVVDMSLSSGQGSLTVKNSNLYTGYAAGRVSATRHCNGVDVWVVTRDWYYSNTVFTGTYTPNFRAYLLTSTGVSTTAVLSSAATYTYNNNWWYDWGCMKISPNGKKLGLANYNNGSSFNNMNNQFEMYDFDNTTGAVSNSLALLTNTSTTNWWGGWGCEFSPDGTKFYGSRIYTNGEILQWNLCAGSNTAIVASIYSVSSTGNVGSIQLAPDGKIYCSRYNQQSLGVINNPNSLGSSCNYSATGQSISPKVSYYSLPNFMSSYFIQGPPIAPFTYTVSNNFGCQSAAFTSPATPNQTISGCAATGYSLNNLVWNFGDLASGANNTSTVTNPIHAFTFLGTYTVQLILYFSCGGGTDTIRMPVNINQPCISVNSTSITCANLGSATVAATGGIGPFSYTWMPTAQAGSVATGLSPGSYTLTVHDFGNNFTYTALTVFTSLIPLTGNVNTSASITCNGATTGTANVTSLAGGSGSQNYLWYNTTTSYTNPVPTNLSAGLWSVTVTDAVTGCQIYQNFYISQPPPLNLTLAYSTPTTCAGTSIALTGTNSGGTPITIGPGYTYTWTGGPPSATFAVSQGIAGTYIYSLSSQDSYSCLTSNTISVDFIPNPVLTVANTSICPLTVGTLTVLGATSYTWANNTTNTTFTDNPLSTTQYSVVGSALGCTSAASAYIILHPLPVPVLNSNSPRCNGQTLQLNGGGGASYQWTGPLGFNPSVPNPAINPAVPGNSGAYNVTVTSVNGCTASTTATLTVNPSPTVSALGGTVCVTQTLNLTAASFAGSGFVWTGPLSFVSAQQNPSVANPPVQASGTYTVKATSAVGCTNTATADVTVTAMPVPTLTSNGPRCDGDNLNLSGSGGVSYVWAGPNFFSSTAQNPSIYNVTVPAGGIYTLVATTGPCVASTTKPITVYPLPTPTAINSGPVCETKKLFLNASNSGVVYTWTGPNAYLDFSQNPPVIDSVKLNQSGVYTLSVIDGHTCKATTTTTVSIMANPHVSATGATVCLNGAAIVTASGAVSYFWTGPNFYVSNKANALIPSATDPAVTFYTVVGSAANTCTDVSRVNLVTIPLPQPSLTVLPKTKPCLNQTINLEGFGGQLYDWQGPGNLVYTGKAVSFILNSMGYAGIYTLTVTDANGCMASTITAISIDDLPTGSLLGTAMKGCVPFCSDFKFYSAANNSTLITTSWELNKQFISAKSFSYCFAQPGDYIITGNFKDTLTNCVNTATFVVNAYPLPVADFVYSPQKPVEGLEDVIFTNSSTGSELNGWNWFFVDNDGYKSSNQNTSYFFAEAGLYPVAMVVQNSWGCSDSIVKLIKVESDFNVYVPNAFTPNGDDDNDVFLPVMTGIKSYQFSIFNRWGAKVFETANTTAGWDGTFKGQDCKSDVYIWKISASGINGEARELNGHVTLYR